jgi:hypothetical protein
MLYAFSVFLPSLITSLLVLGYFFIALFSITFSLCSFVTLRLYSSIHNLRTKLYLYDLKTQSVPRSRHCLTRL